MTDWSRSEDLIVSVVIICTLPLFSNIRYSISYAKPIIRGACMKMSGSHHHTYIFLSFNMWYYTRVALCNILTKAA